MRWRKFLEQEGELDSIVGFMEKLRGQKIKVRVTFFERR